MNPENLNAVNCGRKQALNTTESGPSNHLKCVKKAGPRKRKTPPGWQGLPTLKTNFNNELSFFGFQSNTDVQFILDCVVAQFLQQSGRRNRH